jgi:hypothetical protein
MARIELNQEGLATDGQALAQGAVQGAAGSVKGGLGCVPAGADTTSIAAATSFTAWEGALGALIAHSHAIRAAGGTAVQSTSHVLASTDEANAASIAACKPGAGGPVAEMIAPIVPDAPIAPQVPGVPAVPEPVSGDIWAAQIHGGPGSAPLRAYAARLRSQSTEIAQLAEQTRTQGRSIDGNWYDGHQQAGSNVGRLATWYEGVAAYANQLADAAEQSAGHVDTAREQTPHPTEFVTLTRRVNDAARHFSATGDPVPLQAANADLAEAHRKALEGHGAYSTAMSSTTTDAPPLPTPAKPITGPDTAPPEKKLNSLKDKTGEGTGEGEEPDGHTRKGSPNSKADEPFGALMPEKGLQAMVEPAEAASRDAASGSQNPAGAPARAAGTMLGRGIGQAAQASEGMPGGGMPGGMPGGGMPGGMPGGGMPSSGGMPSGGGMPGGGMPSMPKMPSADDLGLGKGLNPSDLGLGGTSPSSMGGGDVGAGGMPPASVPSTAVSAASQPPPATPVGPAAPAAPAAGGRGMGPMGMMPPMMGGAGGGKENERDKELHPDKRVLHREVPNSEPVFGEVERRRQGRPRKRPSQEEESGG